MKGRPGELAHFLAPSPANRHRERLEARRAGITDHPKRHAVWHGLSPEMWSQLVNAGQRAGLNSPLPGSPEKFSTSFEPDWIWVDRTKAEPTARGSSVCFPSGWAPEEITGKAVSRVHGVVPGLNPQLGVAIQRFLQRLKLDQAWERFNWGLAPTAQLNRHPGLHPPRLEAEEVVAGNCFLRTEHHLFWAISPETVLFLIRIECHSWAELAPAVRQSVRLQLEGMTPDLLAYKGIPAIPAAE